jgi:hypothetical protein
MKINENLRDAILEVIDNQINANDPAETATTLKRLLDEGYSEVKAKQYIGQALAVELFYVLKHKVPFNETRYINNLRNLPREPSEKYTFKNL